MQGRLVLAFMVGMLAVLTLVGCEEESEYRELDFTVKEVEVTYHDTLLLNSTEMEDTTKDTLIEELNEALDGVEFQSNLSVDEYCDAVGLRMLFETESGDDLTISYTSIVQDGDCKPMAAVRVNDEWEGYADGEVYSELVTILENTGDLDW